MSSTTDQIYKKLNTVAQTVREELRKKGVVIPVKNSNGSIKLENYTIVKQKTGFFTIFDKHGDAVVEKINLAQSAALMANSLALGRWLDTNIRDLDREYGYKSFEYELLEKNASKNLKNNNVDRADMLFTKSKIAKNKVESAKNQILSNFEKLRSIR